MVALELNATNVATQLDCCVFDPQRRPPNRAKALHLNHFQTVKHYGSSRQIDVRWKRKEAVAMIC